MNGSLTHWKSLHTPNILFLLPPPSILLTLHPVPSTPHTDGPPQTTALPVPSPELAISSSVLIKVKLWMTGELMIDQTPQSLLSTTILTPPLLVPQQHSPAPTHTTISWPSQQSFTIILFPLFVAPPGALFIIVCECFQWGSKFMNQVNGSQILGIS